MNTRRMVIGGLGLAAVGGTLGYGLAPKSPSTTRQAESRFPDVPVQAHDGRQFRFYSDLVRGKVVAINMMYVQCEGSCPAMIANLRRLQSLLGERLGRDVFLYSISLQPALDTTEVLKDYAERQGARPGWLFLTGKEADIRRLRYGLGFYDPVPEVDDDLTSHIGMLRIGNDRTNRWTMAPALCDAERIIATINHVDTAMVATAYQRATAPA
ncbi:SCO family protein [Pseudomonas sp. JS3066]|uniref:SCO family protein n=1 Tax=unclassified Pseudomonas TaxID=196821 RepID=UPI000EA85FBA|nr:MULTISPECIES: SCO family protein [unclassified Pseudomonas]AYF86639.1 SCO family protein [Pseudomonas sp. DY-1]MDH4653534.1 SCO family protein [Pseudomonas sp. BN606]MRK22118.1 SCO family protein [Pseudomonas sp. JG-B]WVK95889.1 SCO family protein [Pseudomonas sp. JS3066]